MQLDDCHNHACAFSEVLCILTTDASLSLTRDSRKQKLEYRQNIKHQADNEAYKKAQDDIWLASGS
jgi:hypothetical protein